MREEQINREKMFFELFQKIWKDFPLNSIVEKDEEPDFILSIKEENHKLGIELTELIIPNNSNFKFSIAERYSLESRIVEEAKNNFQKQRNLPLHLTIHFQPNFRCKKNEIKKIAKEISQLIIEETDNFNLDVINQFNKDYPIPVQLIDIRGTYYPGVDDSVWNSQQGGFLPDIDNSYLYSLIKKKEELIPKYKEKVDKIYLLIVEGIVPVSWFNRFLNWNKTDYPTEFDRVLLMRSLERTVYEIG